MTYEERVALWDAINHYVATFMGDTASIQTRRQLAIVEVERIVETIEEK